MKIAYLKSKPFREGIQNNKMQPFKTCSSDPKIALTRII
jgi:hypothetical protein